MLHPFSARIARYGPTLAHTDERVKEGGSDSSTGGRQLAGGRERRGSRTWGAAGSEAQRTSKEIPELLGGEVRSVKDLAKGARFDGMLPWNDEKHVAVRHGYMSSLAKNPDTPPLRGMNDTRVGDLGQVSHKVTSTVRIFLRFLRSSRLSK